jgi:hypothetical protein
MKNLDEKSQVLECYLLLIIFVIVFYEHRIHLEIKAMAKELDEEE